MTSRSWNKHKNSAGEIEDFGGNDDNIIINEFRITKELKYQS